MVQFIYKLIEKWLKSWPVFNFTLPSKHTILKQKCSNGLILANYNVVYVSVEKYTIYT